MLIDNEGRARCDAETCLHVLDSIADPASGPSYSVPRLCEALTARGVSVRLMTLGEYKPSLLSYKHDAFPLDFGSVPILKRMRLSRALKMALRQASRTTTIIHAHGLWLMANVYPAAVAKRTGTPLILSPRGMLGGAALSFSARKKRIFWALWQRAAVSAATCIHATSTQEYEDIRTFGLKMPVAIIPNGIDLPHALPRRSFDNRARTVLYLGRLHPKKGLDRLIDAWELVKDQHPEWNLEIAGPIDSEYAKWIKKRVEANLASRARLIGPVYGRDKAEAYLRADLFVLPTLNENFAITVAEALAHGTPVISSKGAPWGELSDHDCGWWIDCHAESLAATLHQAMSLDRRRLAAMGEAGRAWMARDFAWDVVGASMQSVYRWLSGAGERPACVVHD
jgi:glycosyltransferase involved in cell wall biosynthesis